MAETSNLQTSCWKLANKVMTKTGCGDKTWNLNVQRISKSKPCMCSRLTLGSYVKLKCLYFKKKKLTMTRKIQDFNNIKPVPFKLLSRGTILIYILWILISKSTTNFWLCWDRTNERCRINICYLMNGRIKWMNDLKKAWS